MKRVEDLVSSGKPGRAASFTFFTFSHTRKLSPTPPPTTVYTMPNTLTNMLFAAALAVGATTTAQAGAPVFPDSRALGFGLPGEPHEALGRCMKAGQPCGGAIATTFGYHCCDGSVCDADETGTIGKCVIPVTKIRGRSPFDQKPVVGCLPAGSCCLTCRGDCCSHEWHTTLSCGGMHRCD